MKKLKHLHLELSNAGIPIDGISDTGVSFRVDYKPEATPSQIAEAEAIVAAFDFSDEAQAARNIHADKVRAKNLVSDKSPITSLVRNSLRVVFQSLVESRQKINQLVDAQNAAHGTNIQRLQNRTWQQVLDATKSHIDSETDPES